MSTKNSLAYGNNFHLYKEVFDDNSVYLELENIAFETSNNRIAVAIPLAIWETIRQHKVADTKYAAYSDEEIENLVAREVDERIELALINPRESIFGFAVYGSGEDSRQIQIEKGIEYFQQLRKRQRKLAVEIEALKPKNNGK